MTDNLVKRLRGPQSAEVDYATRHEGADSIDTLTAQLESTLKDRKLILEERDRTFALMLARAEKAEADNARLREALNEAAQILSQCTFETIIVRGQYIDRREAVSRARAALAQKGAEP